MNQLPMTVANTTTRIHPLSSHHPVRGFNSHPSRSYLNAAGLTEYELARTPGLPPYPSMYQSDTGSTENLSLIPHQFLAFYSTQPIHVPPSLHPSSALAIPRDMVHELIQHLARGGVPPVKTPSVLSAIFDARDYNQSLQQLPEQGLRGWVDRLDQVYWNQTPLQQFYGSPRSRSLIPGFVLNGFKEGPCTTCQRHANRGEFCPHPTTFPEGYTRPANRPCLWGPLTFGLSWMIGRISLLQRSFVPIMGRTAR